MRNTILPCLAGFNHMFDVNGCGLTSLGAEILCFCLYCCVLYLKETCMVYTTKGFVHKTCLVNEEKLKGIYI